MNKAGLYIQCDARYCANINNNICNITVIERTIDKIRRIQGVFSEILIILNECEANRKIEDNFPSAWKIIWVNEMNATERYLFAVRTLSCDWVFRACIDQCCLDEKYNKILIEQIVSYEQRGVYFRESSIAHSVLLDAVNSEYISANYDELIKSNADIYFYLNSVKNEESIFFHAPYLVMDLRANSFNNYMLCKSIEENDVDYEKICKKMINQVCSNSTLHNDGLWNSWFLWQANIEEFFYTDDNKIYPWWVTSAIKFVESRLLPHMKVFEWGSGNSTLFWEQYVDCVVSCEHDKTWYEKMKQHISKTKLIYKELVYGGDYSKAILFEKDEFDIILVDGRDRNNCIVNAYEKLTESGIIILDNAERENYLDGIDYLMSKGFKRLDFEGELFGLPTYDLTTIFYRTTNVLGI